MTKKFRRCFINPSLLITLLITITSCGLVNPETMIYSDTELYYINSDTILDTLNQGKAEIFIPREESTTGALTVGTPVQWDETDYLRVAQALHEFVWGESLGKWSLSRMSYGVDCKQIDNGLQDAYFIYIKNSGEHQQESRFVSNINITPSKNSVSVNKEEFSPPRKNWQTINLTNLEISALDALEIAEHNGGGKTRATIENACEIHLSFIPESKDCPGWRVAYYLYNDELVDNYCIDPKTGEPIDRK